MTLDDLERDKEGYLKDITDWNIDIAEAIALEEQIKLTDDHWLIINLMRNFYKNYKKSLSIRPLVKAIAKELGPEKGNSLYLHKLFPKGPAKQANKIAGLPKPIRCI